MISITVFSTFEGERSGCLNSSRNRSRRHLPNSLCSRSFGIYGQFNLNGDFDGCCRRQFHLSASLRCQMVFVRIGYCSADMTFTIPCSTYEFRIHAKLCRNGNYFHSPELSQSPMVRKFSSNLQRICILRINRWEPNLRIGSIAHSHRQLNWDQLLIVMNQDTSIFISFSLSFFSPIDLPHEFARLEVDVLR